MLTEEQKNEIEFAQTIYIQQVKECTDNADKIKHHLTNEVLLSVSYLKMFRWWLEAQKFDNLEHAWRFMNDIRGIIEKIFYVNQYIYRKSESLNEATAKASIANK